MRHDGHSWWKLFCPPDARVLALPSWRSPRLLLSSAPDPLRRWQQSSLYPASRPTAKLYRFVLRCRAATGLAKARTLRSSSWPLWEFVEDVSHQLTFAVILVGTPGPAQAITVQLRDEKNRVLGYLKYAEKDAARRRLQQERTMLLSLPEGIGPKLMRFGPLGDGEALLKSALPGKVLPTRLPPPGDLTGLLASLSVLPAVPIDAHQWVHRMRELGVPELDAWLAPLAGRDWPVVVQHGDFAPWNLLRQPDGTLRAVDWEYGTLESFPYLDLAHYLLQVLGLVRRKRPLEAARYTIEYLSRQPGPALSSTEAWSLTRLAAYDTYRKLSDDGQSSKGGLQPWRRAIWEGEMRDL